ncbi:MAG: carboxypeptidase-like regulatory domain-containing protein [Bacteroidota bacterium]
MKRLFYTIALFILLFPALKGQANEPVRYVQVNGIITDESYRPVPGVAVVSKKLHRGTISERTGIYSITSIPGDTIFFRALGFKRYHTIIPLTYKERHCKVDIALEIDTIQIEEITILPWKSYNEFIKDVTKERPVDPIIENMNDNIASIYVAIANQTNIKVSPEAGYRYAMEQNFSAMSTRNQYPVNNLLNPFAWAKFINGVKHGLFKNQKFNKPVNAKVRKKIKKTKSK